MALVVPGVARYTVHQSMVGHFIANVFDFDIDTATGDRNDHVESVARRVLEAWHATFRENQADNLNCNSVSWVDLDAADGTTGEVTTSGATTWPATGAAVGDTWPTNVAILVTKQTQAARGQRNGRFYIAGGQEGMSTTNAGNTLEASVLTGLQAQADEFLTTVNSGEAGYDANMAVVHRTVDPLVGDFSDVSNLIVQSTLATQRRRLR